MKTLTLKTSNKTKALGLLVAALMPAGAAFADGAYYHGTRDRGIDVNGTVIVSKEIPGGVITVGATIGKPRPVVVEERKVVIVKQEERCEPKQVVIVKEQPQKVIVVREAPRREVVVVREQPRKVIVIKEQPKKVIIVKDNGRRGRGHGHDRHDRDEWRDNDGRNGRNGRYDRHDRHDGHDHDGWDRDYDRDFSNGKQVSIQKQGPNGNYAYYEDAHQVSIQDNRNGVNRHVYVQK